MTILQKRVLYHGATRILACDGRCDKAWGINGRPRHHFTSPEVEPDDYVYITDEELGAAPPPGRTAIVFEGFEMKPSAEPLADPERMNKWCARECERSTVAELGEAVEVPDLSDPRPNMPHRSMRQARDAAAARRARKP